MYITLQRLTIDNFKGCRHFEFLPAGADCTIAGENATGKTTVYDSLVWLLFGKDSKGRKDFDIKPLDADGNVADHSAITSVEAVLDNDGEALKLRRTYYEKWTTKRGRSDAEFDGHGSDYYVDDVPVKKNAFDDAVSALVDESTFRMLTNVSYFPEQMKWQDRRSMLFTLAGVKSDAEIMATDPHFTPLAKAMNGKTVDDFKKILTAQRKGLAKTKADTPARIDEQSKTVAELERVDFDALRDQRQKLTDREEEYKQQLSIIQRTDSTTRFREQGDALMAQLKALEAENLAYRASQSSDTSGWESLRREIQSLEDRVEQARSDISLMEKDEAEYTATLKQLRAEWSMLDNQEFDGSTTCPTCGQDLPKSQADQVKRSWVENKTQRLKAIEDRGVSISGRLESVQIRIVNLRSYLEDMHKTLELRRADLEHTPAPSPITDMPDYAERKIALSGKIAETDKLIASAKAPNTIKEFDLNMQIQATRQDIMQMDAAIAQESRLNAARQRVEELMSQARKASEALENLDSMLFLIEDFSRYKARFVEDSINDMFEHASFRLFREQINGGLDECCDVVYKGIPYNSLNNGARINIGIDVIKTISTRTGVSVPLFVDNAEAVTNLWDSGSQQIRLMVDETAKELTIR